MSEVHEYYCKKCGNKVAESDMKCQRCKSLLASEGAVKIKKIRISKTKEKILENIYNDKVDLSKLSSKDRCVFKKHKLDSEFPIWACIILHYISVGIFDLIYYGVIHGKLPYLENDDPTTGKAIGFMFIPIYNIYWYFFFWLRLIDRIKLQYKLRKKKYSLNKTFFIIILIGSIIPYAGFLVFMPIMIGLIQNAINRLVEQK